MITEQELRKYIKDFIWDWDLDAHIIKAKVGVVSLLTGEGYSIHVRNYIKDDDYTNHFNTVSFDVFKDAEDLLNDLENWLLEELL